MHVFLYSRCCSLEVWCVVLIYKLIFKREMRHVQSDIGNCLSTPVLELPLSCQLTKVIVIIDFVCSLCTWHHMQHAHRLPERKPFIGVKASFLVSLLCFYTTLGTTSTACNQGVILIHTCVLVLGLFIFKCSLLMLLQY